MEKKNSCARAGFLSILWGVLAILLCAAPYVRAAEVALGETLDIETTLDDSLFVYGTVNLKDGGYVTGGLYAFSGSTVNITGGHVDPFISVYTGATVTVVGTDSQVTNGTIDPSGSYFTIINIYLPAVLTGTYGGGGDINLAFYSDLDVAILLAAPGGGVTQVEIDIKPGSDLNPINPGSNGLIPVAILTTDDFDAADVNSATVTLAGAEVAVRGKAEKLMARLEDVDGDGDLDLLVQVETQSDGDPWESGTVTLTGKTYDGQDIEGTDEVIIVPAAE